MMTPAANTHTNPTARRRTRQGRKTLASSSSSSSDACGYVGNVLPSDQAFIDAILEQMDSHQLSHPSFFDLKSVRNSQHENGVLIIHNEHRLTYSDQLIFEISTTSQCDGINMWGQTSSCTIRDGCLRVKVSDKSRNRTAAAGQHNNNWESFVFPLEDLVRKSAQARQSEMLGVDGSPRFVGGL